MVADRIAHIEGFTAAGKQHIWRRQKPQSANKHLVNCHDDGGYTMMHIHKPTMVRKDVRPPTPYEL